MKIDCIYLWITLIIHDMTTDKHQKDEKAAIQQHNKVPGHRDDNIPGVRGGLCNPSYWNGGV